MSIQSSTSSGSTVSSMDSVNEELQSLRKSASRQNLATSTTRRGLFDFSRKAFSTNSSPIRAKDEAATSKDYNSASLDFHGGNDRSTDDDDYYDDGDDDDDFDTKSLGFDPFVETTTEVEIPIANSTILSKPQKSKAKSKNGNNGAGGVNDGVKSVRFKDWESFQDNSQAQVPQKLVNKQKQRPVSQLQSMFLKPNLDTKDRSPSSEYSATPDTTEVSESHDYSNSLTLTQKKFLLPAGLSSDLTYIPQSIKKDQKPLSGQGKSKDKSVPSSVYDSSAIVSASTDGESSVFSKTGTLSAPTDIESPTVKNIESNHFLKPTSSSHVNGLSEENEDGSTFETVRKVDSTENQSRKYLRHAESTPKGKPFSLRLQGDDSKINSDGSVEESSVHVDILEQPPPAPLSDEHQESNFKSSQNPRTRSNKNPTLVKMDVHGTNSSAPRDVKGLYGIEDDAKNKVKQILETLSQDKSCFASDFQGDNKGLNCYIDIILDLVKESDKKSNALKIQLIKLSKQQHDHEDVISQKNKVVDSLNAAVTTLNEKLESLQLKHSAHEGALKAQEKTLKIEAQKYRGYEKKLATRESLLEDCRSHIEEKELFIESVSRLVSENSTLRFEISNEKLVFTELKSLIRSIQKFREQEKLHLRSELLHNRAKADLDEDLKTLRDDYEKLSRNHQLLKDQDIQKEKSLILKDTQLEDLRLKNTTSLERLKSAELSQSKLQNELENELFRNKELEARILELENAKLIQDKKALDMEKILQDQLSLVNEVQQELDGQTSTINNLEKECESLNLGKKELIEQNKAYQDQKNKAHQDSENLRIELEKESRLNEESNRRMCTSLKQKDEDILRLNGRVKTLEQIESNLALELKDTRAKFSAKYTQCSNLEKKNEALNNNLKDSNEKNRNIRSELLKNNGHIQEIKRTLLGLSYSILQNLDGIIDADSLSAVRDDLTNDKDDGALEKMHNVSLFIEEAVALIIKEHWSLSKSLSESRKGSVSNNSLNALQQIIEAKNKRLKLLEQKLSNYETAIREISKSRAKSSFYGQSSSVLKRVNFHPSSSASEQDSVDSNLTVLTTNRDNKDSKRLLSLLKQNGSISEISSEN